MLSKLKDRSIVAMKSAWVDKTYLYILLDYALCGDLHSFLKSQGKLSNYKSNCFNKIGKLSFELSKYFSAQIVGSLAFLRSKNIVHRDLKPANIVLNENYQTQLTDFGTAKDMFSSKTSGSSDISYVSGLSNISTISGIGRNSAINSAMGSPAGSQNGQSEDLSLEELVGSECYISPEMLINRSYSYSSDIWAVGIIIYQFFVGQVPFKGKTQDQTFELIKKCKYEMPAYVPEEAKDLIQKILVKEPENRIGAQEIQDLMNHKFFTDVDFETIVTEFPPEVFELTTQ